MKEVLAWHWVVKGEDGKLKLRDGRDVPPIGVPLEYKGEVTMCTSGLHASESVLDALFYIPDNATVLCRVKCELIEDEQGDKLVCRKRTVLQTFDCEKLLHEFACRCAEKQLKAARVKNKWCWGAIEAKRKWLRGEITDAELEAARDAACKAAYIAFDVSREAAHKAAKYAAWRAPGYAASKAAWWGRAGHQGGEEEEEAELLSMLKEEGWDGA